MKKLKKLKKRRPALPELEWTPTLSLQMAATRPDATLVVVATRGPGAWGDWLLAAFQGPPPGTEGGAAAVFANHSHADLGEFPILELALKAGRAYARAWKKKPAPETPCPCKEIKP